MAESDIKEFKDDGEPQDEVENQLITLSEAISAFLEMAFKSKINNSVTRTKIKKFWIPHSQWIRCPKIDAVVLANISRDIERTE